MKTPFSVPESRVCGQPASTRCAASSDGSGAVKQTHTERKPHDARKVFAVCVGQMGGERSTGQADFEAGLRLVHGRFVSEITGRVDLVAVKQKRGMVCVLGDGHAECQTMVDGCS